MFRLVFWWLTCVPVFFSFSYLLVLYLRFFRVFFYSNFRLLCLFIDLIYAQSVSFTCFQSVFIHTFVCSITRSALLFSAMQSHNLHTVTLVVQCF